MTGNKEISSAIKFQFPYDLSKSVIATTTCAYNAYYYQKIEHLKRILHYNRRGEQILACRLTQQKKLNQGTTPTTVKKFSRPIF